MKNLFENFFDCVPPKRRHAANHLVKNAAKRPDITLAVVRLVAPNLWTSIIRRSSLSVAQTFFNDLADVEITQLRLHVLKQEQIRTLHIAMQNATDVEGAESADDLNEDVPDLLLLDVGLPLLIVTDFLEDVAVVGVLHHKAQA